MRKAFHQYFKPTRTELEELWQNGLLSFDASVLLNVYGYSTKTRDQLVEFIEKHSPRVRLPHQFGLEFARNRSSVIAKQVRNYLKVEEVLSKLMKDEIAPKRDHPYLSKKCTKAFHAILGELEESRRSMEKLMGTDPYADRMFGIFEGRVGKCPTAEERLKLETEAQERYTRPVPMPPGFADVKEKGFPDACGDYIAWHQLMEIAIEEKKSVILVTDDAKEDWWLLDRGRMVGPRPELLEEFSRLTTQRFYMYNSETFLREAKEFTLADVRDEVLEEVSERSASELETFLRTISLKSAPIGSEQPDSPKGMVAPVKAAAEMSGEKSTGLKQPPTLVDNAPDANKAGPRID